MKTLFLTCLTLFGIGISGETKAQSTVETPSFIASVYPVPNSFKVRVVVSKEYGKKFSLSVLDEKQNVLYFGQMTKK
ncbi:hypothetical protein [Runella sp.]|jgi:cytochrome oxidase Cu insertion factor (SCO1/SenC/PrrC family)|uniref:hypothetical protein n=1 Tax=Runella sp. TaxID=1960881 RepID=UPI0026292751|nr:hypothetical protein [Runella sp.]